MVGAFSYNARNPSPGSWLDKWLRKRARQPNEFECGVRVVEGDVPGEGRRWSYRRSGADPLIVSGWVTLRHGLKCTLHVHVDPTLMILDGSELGARPHTVVLSAVERDSGALLQISVDMGELERFGIKVG